MPIGHGDATEGRSQALPPTGRNSELHQSPPRGLDTLHVARAGPWQHTYSCPLLPEHTDQPRWSPGAGRQARAEACLWAGWGTLVGHAGRAPHALERRRPASSALARSSADSICAALEAPELQAVSALPCPAQRDRCQGGCWSAAEGHLDSLSGCWSAGGAQGPGHSPDEPRRGSRPGRHQLPSQRPRAPVGRGGPRCSSLDERSSQAEGAGWGATEPEFKQDSRPHHGTEGQRPRPPLRDQLVDIPTGRQMQPFPQSLETGAMARSCRVL